MLTEQDKAWLTNKYPELVIDADKISGEIEFTATYNEQIGRFLKIEEDTVDGVGGVRLSGRFRIRIEDRIDTSHSRLPSLFVEGLDPISARHFNQTDFSACTCNPLEEDEFIEPSLDFQRYMQELVIPFLYGQVFFTNEGRWPWFDYAHGGLGLLESYAENPSRVNAEKCLQRISRELPLWVKVKPLLVQRSRLKGHAPCPCEKRDHIRRCHPVALKGIQLLREDLKKYSIPIG